MRLILPILFLILSIGLFIFGVNKYYKEVSALRADIAIYNKALNNSTDLQRTEDSLITAYNEIKKSDKERLNNFLPGSVNNIQFILEIERIASLHNMPIKDIKFDPIKKDAATGSNVVVSESLKDTRPYGVFPIEFTTEGRYEKFVAFLKDLEANLRLSDIKSISFKTSEKDSFNAEDADPNSFRYSLKVETYWLK